MVGGWKTLIVECPRCKIEWEERRFQATPPNSCPPLVPIPSTDRNDRPPEVVHVSVTLPDRAAPSYLKRNNALSDSFAGNVLRSMLGAQEMQAAFLGHHLGWYQCLASAPEPLSALQLAVQTESSERYAREWCDHQVLSGWIECVDVSLEERRYFMSTEQQEVLVDNKGLMDGCSFVAALGGSLGKVKDAFKRDTGVHWNELDEEVHSTFTELDRMAPDVDIYPRHFPDLHAKWLNNGGRVVFLGSKFGWDGIMFAKSYPKVLVSVVCMDQPALHVTQGNIDVECLQHQINAGLVGATGEMERCTYEMVSITNVHADPTALLRSAKQLSAGKSTIVLSIPAKEEFTGDSKITDALYYGLSLMFVLPEGKCHPRSPSFGTIIRPSQLERIVVQAGFRALRLVGKDDEMSHFIVLLK
jgi:hypothetical protein